MAADKLNAEAERTVQLGGKTQVLKFRLGINELIQVQAALGYDDDEKFLTEWDSGKAVKGLKRFRLAIHQTLLHYQPDFTLDQAGDVISELGIAELGDVLREVQKWSMPKRDEAARGKAAPIASPSAGKAS